jgi:hypothetical protein
MTIDAGTLTPGMNRIDLDVSELAAGTYFYTVVAEGSSVTKKMTVE